MLSFAYILFNDLKVIQTLGQKFQGIACQELAFIMGDGMFEAGIGLMGRRGARNHLRHTAGSRQMVAESVNE